MIRQVKHMGQADSTSIGPTSGADARQGAAGEFGSVECNDVESGRATDTDTTPREAAATPIRVAVVDDHEMFRAGVIATLQPYFHIVGQAADVEGSIAMIADIRPDVVLLDVHVPGGEGGGGAEILAKSQPLSPASAFLALSVSDSPQDVGSVIRAGARGYVTKTITGDDLISSITKGMRCSRRNWPDSCCPPSRGHRWTGPAAHGAATRSWTCCQAASRRSCA